MSIVVKSEVKTQIIIDAIADGFKIPLERKIAEVLISSDIKKEDFNLNELFGSVNPSLVMKVYDAMDLIAHESLIASGQKVKIKSQRA